MKKNNFFILGILAILLIFGMVLTGCNKELDVSGTWVGDINGAELTVNITKIGWTASVLSFGHTDTGSYLRDGNVARLTSDNNGRTIGSIEIKDKNSMALTLNENSIAPGTYPLKRQ